MEFSPLRTECNDETKDIENNIFGDVLPNSGVGEKVSSKCGEIFIG